MNIPTFFGSDALNTLAGQAQLETVAQHYWQRVPCHCLLKYAIERHTTALWAHATSRLRTSRFILRTPSSLCSSITAR